MEKSGYQKGIQKEKEDWKCASVRDGELCQIALHGQNLITMLFATNLDILVQVYTKNNIF